MRFMSDFEFFFFYINISYNSKILIKKVLMGVLGFSPAFPSYFRLLGVLKAKSRKKKKYYDVVQINC
jgi:hypothetical protein